MVQKEKYLEEKACDKTTTTTTYYYYYLGKTRRTPKTGGITIVSEDIRIEFRLDKCANIVFKKGKVVKSQNLI